MSIADKLTTIATNAQKVNESNVELEYLLDARNLGRTLQENINLLSTDKGNIVNAFKSKGANVVNDMPLGGLADEVDTVYNKGYSQAESDMWDAISAFGKRTNYLRAFAVTDFSKYDAPKGLIKPTASYSSYQMFYDYRGTRLPLNIDLSGAKITGTWDGCTANQLFAWAQKLTYIYDMGLQAPTVEYRETYSYCYSVKTIEKVRVIKDTQFITTFGSCTVLENITFEGEIGQNLSMSACKKLTHDSLMNIIGCLYDYASEGSTDTHTLTLGSDNLKKLTEEEQEIAINKGWELK